MKNYIFLATGILGLACMCTSFNLPSRSPASRVISSLSKIEIDQENDLKKFLTLQKRHKIKANIDDMNTARESRDRLLSKNSPATLVLENSLEKIFSPDLSARKNPKNTPYEIPFEVLKW